MAAFLVFIKNRVRDEAEMAIYSGMAGATLAGHPVKPHVRYGDIETLEGPEALGVVMLEFPTMDDARAWYNSDAYTEARKHRYQAADYRVLLLQGV